MKYLVTTIAAAALLAVPAFAGVMEDKAAIEEVWQTYETARVEADAATWLSLWDADGLHMPPGRPTVSKEVLDKVIPNAFKPGMILTMDIVPTEIEVAGDWAYCHGVYTSDRLNADGEEFRVDGKFMTVLRRQDDGTWKIYRDIFNSNS